MFQQVAPLLILANKLCALFQYLVVLNWGDGRTVPETFPLANKNVLLYAPSRKRSIFNGEIQNLRSVFAFAFCLEGWLEKTFMQLYKVTLTQMFSCKFWQNFREQLFCETTANKCFLYFFYFILFYFWLCEHFFWRNKVLPYPCSIKN